MQTAFVILQSILLVLYLVQDTVPLPPLNDLRAQIKFLGWAKTIFATLLMSGLLAGSLSLTLKYGGTPLPGLGKIFLVIWWGLQMLGLFMSWYRPYFFGPTPKDTEMYHALFAGTHTILPKRNGFPGPNTFHLVILHPVMVACTILALLKVAGVF